MTGYRALITALTLSKVREPVGLFFAFFFAPALVLILGGIFGNDPNPDFDGRGYIDATLPAFSSLVLAIIGVMLLPMNQLVFRETGALRRLRLTPMRPSTFLAADLTVNFLVGLTGMTAALAVGWLVYGTSPSGNLVLILLAAALGLVAFLALGYTLASLYPSTSAATGIGNVLMILLMLSSGAFVPMSVMPEGAQRVVEYSPIRHFVELIEGLWAGDSWSTLLAPTAVLLGMTAVFGALGTLLFRRQRV